MRQWTRRLIFIKPFLVTVLALFVSFRALAAVGTSLSCAAVFQSQTQPRFESASKPKLESVTELLRTLGFDEFVSGQGDVSLLERIATDNPTGLLWYIQKIKAAESRISVRNPSEIVEALNDLMNIHRPSCKGGNCHPEQFQLMSCDSRKCTSRLVSGYLITGEERLKFESQATISLFGRPLKIWISEAVMMDALTGALLPHGVGTQALNELIVSAQSGKTPTAFVFVDVNDLGKVNYFKNGFVDGNAYITAIGRILKKSVRSGETFIRLGGDEFVLLVKNLSAQGVHSLSQRLIDAVAQDPDALAVFNRQWRYVEGKIEEIKRAQLESDLSGDLFRFISGFKERFSAKTKESTNRPVTFRRFKLDATEILEDWLAKQKVILAPNISVGSTFIRAGDTLDSLTYRASCNANECKRLHKEALGTDARKYGGAPENPAVIRQNINSRSRPIPRAFAPDHMDPGESDALVESTQPSFDFRSLYGS